MDWLSEKYPDTFDKYYRPRFEYCRANVKRPATASTTARCPCCARSARSRCCSPSPAIRPASATARASYEGETYHFCSDGCKNIFDHEPEKYVQAWLPVHQIYQGDCFGPDADPTSPDFNPLLEVIKWYRVNVGVDNAPYEGSADQKNFETWRAMSTTN